MLSVTSRVNMFKIRTLLLSLVCIDLISFSSKAFTAADPCHLGNYQPLNDPMRSTGNIVQAGVTLLCDYDLQHDWYRFQSYVGDQMPTTPVPAYRCGTQSGVWLMGSHPNVGVEADVEVCADPIDQCSNPYSKAFYSWAIKVKNCNGYYVYKLTPTPFCNLAYCAGNLAPCLDSQTQVDGQCLNISVPDVVVPTIKPEMMYIQDGEVYQTKVSIICEIPHEPWSNVTFHMQWIVDGELEKEGNLTTEQFGAISSADKQGDPGFNAGSRVMCKVRACFNIDNAIWSEFKYSKVFYAGMEVSPRTAIIVKENYLTLHEIKVKSNIPFPCPVDVSNNVNNQCGLQVKLQMEGNALMPSSKCNLMLTEENNYEDQLYMNNIRNIIDINEVYEIPFSFNFPIRYDDSGKPFPIQFDNSFFWKNYLAAAVPIKLEVANVQTGTCTAVSDPHIKTFDRDRYYHLIAEPGPGTYTLMKNADSHFEVQIRVWPCWNALCICGVVIRDWNDVLKVDTCGTKFNQVTETVVKISHRCLSKKFEINRDGSIYTIRVGSGREVISTIRFYGMDVDVKSIPDDDGKIEGLCGKFNDDPESELKHKKQHKLSDENKNLFETFPDVLGDSGRLCVCEDGNGDEDEDINIKCNTILTNSSKGETPNIVPKNGTVKSDKFCLYDGVRKRRALNDDNGDDDEDDNDDDIFDDNVDYEFFIDPNFVSVDFTWPTSNGITLENATNYCNALLQRSKFIQACLEKVEIDINGTIESCVMDIQISEDLSIGLSSLDGLQILCKDKIYKNISLYEKSENGTLIPPKDLVADMCPSMCNLRGNCSNETCICEDGYTGNDCSISYKNPPELYRIMKDGLCDIRKYRCSVSRFIGSGFVEEGNLTCSFQDLMHIAGDQWITNKTVIKLSGVVEGMRKARCPLPQRAVKIGNPSVQKGIAIAGYLVSVSQENQTDPSITSNQLKIVIYDSACKMCNSSGYCEDKLDTCEINGFCFAEYSPNPDDWCQQCLSQESRSKFSKRKVNLPPRITSSLTQRAFYHRPLTLYLEASDPENRSFITFSKEYSSVEDIQVKEDGIITWNNITTTENITVKLRVTDECNASSIQIMTITVTQCPCNQTNSKCMFNTSIVPNGDFLCQCHPGYTGKLCNNEINECQPSPCINGTCKDQINGFECQCFSGYGGTLCQYELNYCLNNTCSNGSCIELANGYRCDCKAGFTGSLCDEEIDECLSSPCIHSTECKDGIAQYTCICDAGYTGHDCDINIDECSSSTCVHASACVDHVANYSCICDAGYTGHDCDINIDECSSSPCVHASACVDHVANYSCTCDVGYTGHDCDINIDECSSSPCVHASSCVDHVANYSCICDAGYTGRDCNISECLSNSCYPGVLCTNRLEGIACGACPNGMTGDGKMCKETQSPDTSNGKETKFLVSVRLVDEEWNEELKDKESIKFKALSRQYKEMVRELYKETNNTIIKSIKVSAFRLGSVIVDYEILFQSTESDPVKLLKEAVATGALLNATVDKHFWKEDIIETEIWTNGKTTGKNTDIIFVAVSCAIAVLLCVFLGVYCGNRQRKRRLIQITRERNLKLNSETVENHTHEDEEQPRDCIDQ